MVSSISPTPLFTTSPLRRPSFASPFFASPVSTEDSHTLSPSSPTQNFISSRPIYSEPEPLTFTKVAIPSGPASIVTTTDSEAFSDNPLDSSSTLSRISRSPSLLTCLFQSNSRPVSSSRTTSSSGSSQPTPITPTSGSGVWACKPILRRSTTASASPSATTSASEDNGVGRLSRTAFGLTSLDKVVEGRSVDATPTLHTRKSCTLKFAVARAPPSENGGSPLRSCSRSRMSRSPAPVPVWDELPCALPVEDESDEDEGYVEDEEGGFTSDEEEVETFAGPSRLRWEPKFEVTLAPASPYMTPKRGVTVEVYSTTDDNAPTSRLPQSKGRKISIAEGGKCVEKCSRHLSPPPPCFSLEHEEAPPPARSPSAAEFCRRREGGISQVPRDREQGCHQLRGWRSDDSAFLPGRKSRTNWSRKTSLPGSTQQAHRSILRSTRSSISSAVPMKRSSGTTTPVFPGTLGAVPHITRRSSAPATGLYDLLPTEVAAKNVLERTATFEGLRKGLERPIRPSAVTASRRGQSGLEGRRQGSIIVSHP